MYSIKNNIFYFIISIAIVQVQSLVELREETKDLVITEAAVRKTVNSLFSIFKLDHVKHKAKFGEFAAIHNFFVTITYQDDDSLKEIARLARVDNIDNSTQSFIALFNEVLNEDNKSCEAGEDEYVTAHIETFIRKLEYLKYKYGFDNNNTPLGINKKIINHLKSDDFAKNNTKTAEKVNEGADLLDINEFWTPGISRRVYGGKREKIKKFPFMASVQFFKKFQCGGSIIKSDLVITSASCLQLAWNNRFFRENPSFLSVQVGCDLYEGCDENIPVLEVYFHPDYNPKNLENNLAVMRLVRVLKFGKNFKKVKKIDFDREPTPLASNTPGITIIGWGARTTSNFISNVWNNRLTYAVLDFYPLRECQEVYSREFVTSRNFCAGFFSKGGGACNRDAGGPGVANGKLMGVVSFGAPICGAPDAPTVFTKVGYYADWIEGIMKMNVPSVRKSTTERITRETWNSNKFTMAPEKKRFKISPFSTHKSDRKSVRSEDALRSLDESKLFKEFVKTMFGSEEVKEYLDQSDSDTDTGNEEKATLNDILRPVVAKSIAETTTEAHMEPQNSADYEEPQNVNKESLRMVTIIDNFEELVVKSQEKDEDATTTPIPMIEKMDEEELAEQNIAKLIDDIDIQELLASAIEKNSVKAKSKRLKSKIKHKGIKRNQSTIKSKEIKSVTYKMKPTIKKVKHTEIVTSTDKIKSLELLTLTNKDKIKPKHKKDKNKPKELNKDKGKLRKQDTGEEDDDKSENTIELAIESNEESETSDDYTYDSNDNDNYEIYQSNQSQAKVDKKTKEVTFRQNSTGDVVDLFSRNELLKLFNEAVADVVGSATNTQYTRGFLMVYRRAFSCKIWRRSSNI